MKRIILAGIVASCIASTSVFAADLKLGYIDMQRALNGSEAGKEAKEKLRPALSPGNLDKTMAAPVTAIIAYDLMFYENLPKTFPHRPDAINGFKGDDKKAGNEKAAFRNGSLQGAYFIIAARALGLDCGPMSGFDNAKVDAAFFPDGRWKSNFLVNVGKGDPAKVMPRNPRLTFDEACRIE